MITYEQIKQANDSIQTMEIKRKDKKGNVTSKDYAEVNQRIKAFRMVYPTGSIETEMVSNENGICIFKATVSCDEIVGEDIVTTILGTGTAYEKEGSSFINQTSYIENCETSAVGRALGMCGFGIDTSIASYEEVANAQSNQGPQQEKKATPKQLELISKLVADEDKVCDYYKIDKIEDLTIQQASEIIKKKGSK